MVFSMSENKIFSIVMQEIYNSMGSSPHIVDVPFAEHEMTKVDLYLRKDALKSIIRLSKMYNCSQRKMMEIILNALGTYMAEQSEDRS